MVRIEKSQIYDSWDILNAVTGETSKALGYVAPNIKGNTVIFEAGDLRVTTNFINDLASVLSDEQRASSIYSKDDSGGFVVRKNDDQVLWELKQMKQHGRSMFPKSLQRQWALNVIKFSSPYKIKLTKMPSAKQDVVNAIYSSIVACAREHSFEMKMLQADLKKIEDSKLSGRKKAMNFFVYYILSAGSSQFKDEESIRDMDNADDSSYIRLGKRKFTEDDL